MKKVFTLTNNYEKSTCIKPSLWKSRVLIYILTKHISTKQNCSGCTSLF